MTRKPGVMLYFEMRPCLTCLSWEEKGRLLDAILAYGECGEIPELTGGLQIAWSFIRQRIDADNEKYQAKCERAREAAANRVLRIAR